MLNNKKLQAIRDKILGVTVNPAKYGDLNSVVYLQQILDAVQGVASTSARTRGNLNEKIYLQMIRNAILGVPNGQFGSLSNSIYLQQIINAFNGVTGTKFGSLADNVYLDAMFSAAHSSGKTPDQVAGLTGWWDASDATRLYTDAGVTLVSADGQTVYRMLDKGGLAGNRYMEQATAADRMQYKVNRQNGLSGLFSATSDTIACVLAISNFITNANAFFVLVWKPISIVSAGQQILCDPSLFIGITGGSANNQPVFKNWDGNYDITPNVTCTPATALVLCGWHTGGNVYIQKNAAAPSVAVASGNTTTLTGLLTLFRTLASADFYELAVFNQPVSDADRSLLVSRLISKWGIT